MGTGDICGGRGVDRKPFDGMLVMVTQVYLKSLRRDCTEGQLVSRVAHPGLEAVETPGSSSTKCGAGSPVGQRDCELEDAQGGGFGTGADSQSICRPR